MAGLNQAPELATDIDEIGHCWQELPSGGWLVYMEPGQWHRAEPAHNLTKMPARMDAIGQNGNTGEHYIPAVAARIVEAYDAGNKTGLAKHIEIMRSLL